MSKAEDTSNIAEQRAVQRPPSQLMDAVVPGVAISAVGVALTAAFATLCCVGPVVVAVLGVGGAVAAASLGPYRPYLLGLSFALLGLAFWRFYSKPKGAPCEGASCPAKDGAKAKTRAILWSALFVTLASLALPYIGLY